MVGLVCPQRAAFCMTRSTFGAVRTPSPYLKMDTVALPFYTLMNAFVVGLVCPQRAAIV
jgi:hypothetical protein